MKRIYLDPADCEKNLNNLYIKGATFHYLINVLRMKNQHIFTGFDGSGYEYLIMITSMNKSIIQGNILKTEKVTEIELPYNINLFQSIPKGHKLDGIISGVAQLGIQKIYPVISNRVIPNITYENILYKKTRWKRIAAEASKIAGRKTIMEICTPIKFEEAVKIHSDMKVIFWEKASIPLKKFFHSITGLQEGTSIHLFVGPEGGYTDEEVALAEQYGAVSVNMGKRIIKVETASVIAVALIIYEIENI